MTTGGFMRWIFALFLAPGFCGPVSSEPTNSAPALNPLFSLAALPLRELPGNTERGRDVSDGGCCELAESARMQISKQVLEDTSETTNSVAQTNLTNEVSLTTSSAFSPVAAAVYERLLQQGYFARREPEWDSPFSSFIETVFEPAVIPLGKVDFSCSILTAIQRQNPLCLLNPIFLQLTW